MDNAPELFYSDPKNVDHFIIDDLLDFPNDEGPVAADGGLEAAMASGLSTDSSTATIVDTSSNSSANMVNFHTTDVVGSGPHGQFSSEFCVPYDDLALEWLSNFEEESFSNDDLQKLKLIQGLTARTNDSSGPHQYQFRPETATRTCPMLRPDVSIPAKARSKRSRAAPGNWTSRLLSVSSPPTAAVSSSSESEFAAQAQPATRPGSQKKKESGPGNSGGGEGRRCLHCATDKTPQWRTGPMGPKTLCNACGVRFKSGRLVPEYRPASSPTFVLTKHSNSHRKVVELRRQKEMVKAHQNQEQQQFMGHHQNMVFDVSNGQDYLIHHHIGPDFRQLM
ncbi:hypothetical protein CASFOL_011101 [Castilleja foliolosa]|uniref:GATA transcription factor n=1 Tax=Castilleja foliolosa TaxID=1961234 RepID=A0ABD3DUI4_9LAMI